MKKIRTVIISDKEKVGLRPILKSEIEKNDKFEVILLSRLKISRIRGEIVPKKPDLLFITASLYFTPEFNDLWGFVRKIKRYLPQAIIIIHAPKLFDFQQEKIFESGADVWIDDSMGYLFLSGILEAVTTGENPYLSRIPHSSQVIIKQKVS